MCRLFRCSVIAFAALFAAIPAMAKDPGSVLGTLEVDGRRGPVANAKVTIQDEQSNRVLLIVTDSRGRFAHVGVVPGVYRVVIEQPGFAEVEILDVEVRSNDRVRLYVQLTPYDEAPFKRRSIRYRRPLIETESSTISTRVL